MARVVVVGGGYAGLASAVRLGKLGHEVTLVERSPELGGALSTVTAGGFGWDAGPSYTLLPAVVRDLFRKSGRPLEREVDLQPLECVREHWFEDGSSVRLPFGSRAAQVESFDTLGAGLGERWASYVDSFGEDWEVLRRGYLEAPWDRDHTSADVAARLDSREMLHRRLRRTFRDKRLRLVAAHPFVAEGHDPRNVPAWAGLSAYVEQRFGAWRPPQGMAALADALTARLATRGVTVLTGMEVRDLVVRGGGIAAVDTDTGEIAADAVVCAIDPRRLPALAGHVVRTMPAIPPVIAHLGLGGDLSGLPDLPHEVVIHGDPMLVVRTGGLAPDGGQAWTVHGRGRLSEDMVTTLARHDLDVRSLVVTRVDRSPRQQVEAWGGSPLGVLWQGRATVRQRLGPDTPIPGVYAVGAHATPGAGLPYAGLSAALVAQVIGSA